MKTDDIDRFWSKVQVSTNKHCWLWRAGKFISGYGEFSLNNKPYLAHRVAYEIFFDKKIPKNLELHHICKNRLCVNPDHLELVTRKEHVSKTDHSNNGENSRKKTRCPRGHLLSGSNLRKYALKLGKRSCRMCFNEQNRKYQESIKH